MREEGRAIRVFSLANLPTWLLITLPSLVFALILSLLTPRLDSLAGFGAGLVLSATLDLTLARMASERSLRTFVVWPPVVHLQRDDDDTPTDGYGGNSSRFIEAYLGMDE